MPGNILGLGDWILATAEVRTLNQETGLQVVVVDKLGKPQWSPVFENNPRIARQQSPEHATLLNAPGCRPYIRFKDERRWYWQDWDKAPGELYFSQAEREFGEQFSGRIMVEPNTKVQDGNKAWSWGRWRELVHGREDRFIQCGKPGVRRLPNVLFVETTFRLACAVMAVSKAFVGTEGGLHHAAAALGTPAVVLFSEFIEPRYTGYDSQKSIRHAGESCGNRFPCSGCRASMEAITVAEVLEALP